MTKKEKEKVTGSVWAILDVSYEARDEAKRMAKLEKKKIGKLLEELIEGHKNKDCIGYKATKNQEGAYEMEPMLDNIYNAQVGTLSAIQLILKNTQDLLYTLKVDKINEKNKSFWSRFS